MRWQREQYLELMTFGRVERPMFVELFGPLVGLEDEWRAQGASPAELDMTAFDWDYVPVVPCGGNCLPLGMGSEPQVLSDDGDYAVYRDFLGRTSRLCRRTATIPLPMDFPVQTMDDWQRLKPLFTFDDWRIDRDAVERARRARQEEGALVVAEIPGAFDMARELMGEVVACLAYYQQPELMWDLVETLRATSLKVLERVGERVTIDQLSVHEDLAGKSGPLIGPAQIETFFKPYYRAAWEAIASRGGRIFQQDSDGNMYPVLDALLDCGLTCSFPMEPAAGMDIVDVRAKYGKKLAFAGGIDKHALRQGKEAIRRELEYKLPPLLHEGGVVFGLDHRIPNGTPLENYRYYVDLGREILGLPARTPGKTGWRRMAF